MKKSMQSTQIIIVATIGAFALSGCAFTTPSYGTGQTPEKGLAKDLAGIATFGLAGRKKQAPIEYRERSPLVVPEGDELKNIRQPGTAVARNTETTITNPNAPSLKYQTAQDEPFLQRVGIKKRKYVSRTDRLVDVPQDYRVVQQTPDDEKARQLVEGNKKKKKKKKRFGIF